MCCLPFFIGGTNVAHTEPANTFAPMKPLQPQVSLFIPCFVDQFSPQTGFNMMRLLEKAGCLVHYNTEQTCCGHPAFNAGYWDAAKEVGEKLINEYLPGHYVVAPSASCTGMIRNGYTKLFENTAVHNTCKKLQGNLFEFSEFVVNVLGNPELGIRFQTRIAWMDTCQALRECTIQKSPRQLLAQVEGLEVAEVPDQETCCGFGGVFATKHENLSVDMAAKKVDNALQTGAEFLVSTDLSCLMHLDTYIQKNNLPIKAIHLVDLLAKGMR